jgi:hypothetical protein
MWKLKQGKQMRDYSGKMKFYRVTITDEDLGSNTQSNTFRNHFMTQRRKQQAFKNKYRKWAWDNCGDTWAISEIDTIYNHGDIQHFFYIGFTSGEDKLIFKLSHDPEEVIIYKGGISLFVRERA